jgi:anti-sigma28 factor (negative regulator of flagellin synthesis)
MQISDSNITVSGLSKSPVISTNTGGPRRGIPGQPPAADQIQLSTLSSHLSAAQGNSPAQVAKLFHLTAAVGDGTYNVATYKIAASVIGDHLGVRPN